MESNIHDIHLSINNFSGTILFGVFLPPPSRLKVPAAIDGKGESIWDVFAAKKGKILNGDNPDIACDFYNQYQKDIDLIKQLNIPNFRFSISWPRILPNGTGEINQAGIDYYNRVIDYCIAARN